MKCFDFVKSFVILQSSRFEHHSFNELKNNSMIIDDLIIKIKEMNNKNEILFSKSQIEYLIDSMCQDSISWGKILSFLTYISYLYYKSQINKNFQTGEHLIQWCSDHFETIRFSTWINEHGGWNKMDSIMLKPDDKTLFYKSIQALWNMKVNFEVKTFLMYIMRKMMYNI